MPTAIVEGGQHDGRTLTLDHLHPNIWITPDHVTDHPPDHPAEHYQLHHLNGQIATDIQGRARYQLPSRYR